MNNFLIYVYPNEKQRALNAAKEIHRDCYAINADGNRWAIFAPSYEAHDLEMMNEIYRNLRIAQINPA